MQEWLSKSTHSQTFHGKMKSLNNHKRTFTKWSGNLVFDSHHTRILQLRESRSSVPIKRSPGQIITGINSLVTQNLISLIASVWIWVLSLYGFYWRRYVFCLGGNVSVTGVKNIFWNSYLSKLLDQIFTPKISFVKDSSSTNGEDRTRITQRINKLLTISIV